MRIYDKNTLTVNFGPLPDGVDGMAINGRAYSRAEINDMNAFARDRERVEIRLHISKLRKRLAELEEV